MRTVALYDRPREKLERLGAGALGDNELLAIVLGHGRARASALDLANALLGGRRIVRSCPCAARRAAEAAGDWRGEGGPGAGGDRAWPPDAARGAVMSGRS